MASSTRPTPLRCPIVTASLNRARSAHASAALATSTRTSATGTCPAPGRSHSQSRRPRSSMQSTRPYEEKTVAIEISRSRCTAGTASGRTARPVSASCSRRRFASPGSITTSTSPTFTGSPRSHSAALPTSTPDTRSAASTAAASTTAGNPGPASADSPSAGTSALTAGTLVVAFSVSGLCSERCFRPDTPG